MSSQFVDFNGRHIVAVVEGVITLILWFFVTQQNCVAQVDKLDQKIKLSYKPGDIHFRKLP